MAVPCIVLSVLNMSELCALADAGIVHFYNGKRGLKTKMGILHILSAAFADSCRHLRAAF